jgi:hypothetical protein
MADFSKSIAAAKTQGMEMLTDAKTYLEAAVAKAGGDVEADIPVFSADLEAYALAFIPNASTQDFVKMLLDGSGAIPKADALAVAYLGQGLLRIEAIIAAIP